LKSYRVVVCAVLSLCYFLNYRLVGITTIFVAHLNFLRVK